MERPIFLQENPRMEKISWTDHVRNEEVLLRVSEQSNILHEIKKRKVNWIGHIFRRNCLLKEVIEGNKGADRSDKKT
jgi:HD superfamily phosphohydrolase